MGVLRDLWYGDLSHRDKLIELGSEFEDLIGQLADYEREMGDELTGSQMELFQGYQEISEKLADLREREAFKEGFVLAMRIWAEVLQTPEERHRRWTIEDEVTGNDKRT